MMWDWWCDAPGPERNGPNDKQKVILRELNGRRQLAQKQSKETTRYAGGLSGS
tara:strand:- start:451 stop:609 length:159 start_codon:yes stop_codon:yes gene_type:complete